jgi:hypothetical protein
VSADRDCEKLSGWSRRPWMLGAVIIGGSDRRFEC